LDVIQEAPVTLSIAWRYPTDLSVVLVLRGGLDWAGSADLRMAISVAADRHPRPSAIVVDLSGVEFIDEIGVGTLVVASRICRQIGIDLAVGSPSPLVRRLLGMERTGRLPSRNAPERSAVGIGMRVGNPGTG
jgi:anti-sigma B factor antagonist